MKRPKELLVATDTRIYEHSVVDEVTEVASKNRAALTIVDVVHASSRIAGLGLVDRQHGRTDPRPHWMYRTRDETVQLQELDDAESQS